MHMPFDPATFNFSKVQSNEVLLHFAPARATSACHHRVIVNVSPLEFGHVLLVPEVTSQLPQALTLESIRLGIELLLLSANRFV